MLIEQHHYPLSSGDGFPWGPVIISIVILGGIGYLGYQSMQPAKSISEPKNKENDGK